jgi:hypothetical protein
MKNQKQSKVEVLQKKVQALTNVMKQLIAEFNDLKTLSEGTLTAFQLYIGKDEWKKIVEEIRHVEERKHAAAAGINEKKLDLDVE